MSTDTRMDTTDCIIFGLLSGLGYFVGLYFSLTRRRKQMACGESDRVAMELEAFLGGRSLPGYALAVSILASAVNGMNIVAAVGHIYAYGFHLFWIIVWMPISAAFVAATLVPLLYTLRISTVFQYLRMRFDNKVGITACVIYFVLSQALGAIGIYSAAIAISTMLSVPLVYTNIAIGLAGTTYTALGGLRSVVWADCIQAAVMLASPIVIVFKMFYDYDRVSPPLRPLTDLNVTDYILSDRFDITTDENMWTTLIASVPYAFVRLGCDQMAVQRFMAARTIGESKRIAIAGAVMVSLFFSLITFSALGVIYWYRDCDPLLSGAIASYDQVLPYYVNDRFSGIKALRGLFLAGLLSASASTVSSAVNSHAATIYMDIVASYFELSARRTVYLMRLLAFASGIIMTLFAIAVPLLGSAMRLFIAFYSNAAGPFAGLVILAVSSPWVKGKAAAWASLLVCGLQLWHAIGRITSGAERPRILYGTLDRCPFNNDSHGPTYLPPLKHESSRERADVFPLYRLSSLWSSFFGALLTIILGTIFSFSKGNDSNLRKNVRLTSPVFLKLWCRFKCLRNLLNNNRISITRASNTHDECEGECDYCESEHLNTWEIPRIRNDSELENV